MQIGRVQSIGLNMPVGPCTSDGKPGYRWGSSGKCYTYTPGNRSERAEARRRAEAQGAAARAWGFVEREDECMDCDKTVLSVEFSGVPKQCCFDQLLAWRVLGEGQKILCKCRNMLTSVRIDKGSFLAEDYRKLAAVVLLKAVFPTMDSVSEWLENNWIARRYNLNQRESERIYVIREFGMGFGVVHTPINWFMRGTLKARWDSLGIVVVEGNLLKEYDNRIPTREELEAGASAVERI